MDDSQRVVVGGLGAGFVLGGIAWISVVSIHSQEAWYLRILPPVVMFVVGAVLVVWALRRGNKNSTTAEATGVFGVETSGAMSWRRIYTGESSPGDHFLVTFSRFRITNRQKDAALSVDVRLHLPRNASAVSWTAGGYEERDHKHGIAIPWDLPADTLECPISVPPGNTVRGDLTFIVPGDQYPGIEKIGDVRLEVVDHVSNRSVMLRTGDRRPSRLEPL